MSETIVRKRTFAQVPDDLIIDKRLSHLAVRVWVRLDRYAGKNGDAFPSRARLADDLGVSKGSIAAALSNLTRAGWITRKPRIRGGVWTTELNERSTVPNPDQDAGRPQPECSTSPTSGVVPEGHETKDPQEGSGSDDPNSGLPAGPDAPRQATRRKPRKPTQLQQERMNADYVELQRICQDVGEDDPYSVWWTLRYEHKATSPACFMVDLVEKGQWEGFVGRHGISQYERPSRSA